MRYKGRKIIAAIVFTIAIAGFAAGSMAFNTFRTASDESRITSEYIDLLRDIKTINTEILEQAKLTNQLLKQSGGRPYQ